jgi:histidinol-phosphate aminotransferase
VRFRPALADIVPYEPGLTTELVRRRYALDDVVKLASNEFPLPPFPEVQQALLASIDQLQRYPDGHTTDLRTALAAHYGRVPGQIVVGNGSCELLVSLGNALLEAGDEVVFAAPSFAMYAGVCEMRGAVAVEVPLRDHTHDVDAMAAAVTPKTRMVILCNPNNPTGTYLPAAVVARLADAVPGDVLLVVDEAYNEFVMAPDAQGALDVQEAHDNVIVLRTFSKIYGLCGLRVGYGLCAPGVKQALDKVRQPFNVNRLAQVAAVEALRHQDQMLARREHTAAQRGRMAAALAARGRATVPSQANFMLVDARGLRVPQEEVFESLLRLGVIVRDGNALGLPGWLRVSVGTEHEIEFFLDRLASLEVSAPEAAEGRPT